MLFDRLLGGQPFEAGGTEEADDAVRVVEDVLGVVGFFGASSLERLPTEQAIEQQARDFKGVEL